MIRVLFLISFLLVALQATSQEVMEYYEHINTGKKHAIDKRFSHALNAYRVAFDRYNKPYARDCYNAVELSVIAKDTFHLNYFLQKAIARGIKLRDVEASGILNEYANAYFLQDIRTKEDSLFSIYASSIHWDLRHEINQMFTEDQEVRQEYYQSSFLKRRTIGKKWEALNAQQVERLMEITAQFGFPGENLIGLDRKDMHPKIVTQNFSAGMPILLFIHHFSQPNPSYSEILISEVKKGNLYNEHFATISDFEAKFCKGKYENFGYFGLRQQPKKMDKKSFNSKREAFGILTIEQIEQLNRVKHLSKFWNRLY